MVLRSSFVHRSDRGQPTRDLRLGWLGPGWKRLQNRFVRYGVPEVLSGFNDAYSSIPRQSHQGCQVPVGMIDMQPLFEDQGEDWSEICTEA
jgi:hypothetical protein